MEQLPFRPNSEDTETAAPASTDVAAWRRALPVLRGNGLTLREVVASDAEPLLALLGIAAVSRFMNPPPPTVAQFKTFISWTHASRRKGRYACYAVVREGATAPVGVFQLRQLESGFQRAEWGFALAPSEWGTGAFAEAARLLVDFAVDIVGVHRLEARAAVVNGRGNGALRKLGAVQEGLLRRGFSKDGRQFDLVLWTILADEWRQAQARSTVEFVH